MSFLSVRRPIVYGAGFSGSPLILISPPNAFITRIASVSVSKQADDQYWKVVNVTSDAETDEYFVRDLVTNRLFGAPDKQHPPEDKYFICDFVDI